MTLYLPIIGKSEQLARALDQQASASGHNMRCHARSQIDLTSPADVIEAYILGLPAETDAVILAAAYTNVDKAETNQETAFAVNGTASKVIAVTCVQRGFALVHITTDYVFDGLSRAPNKTNHPTNPINAYGASKLVGEMGVVESQAKSAVLRTSWVFHGKGKNFLTTMLRRSKTRDQLNIVGDQLGRPTYAGDLADAALVVTGFLVKRVRPLPKTNRVYHVRNNGPVIGWADFAEFIFSTSENQRENNITVTSISMSEYPTPATPPLYSLAFGEPHLT